MIDQLQTIMKFSIFWTLILIYGCLSVNYIVYRWFRRLFIEDHTSNVDEIDSNNKYSLQPSCLFESKLWNHRYIKIKGLKLHLVESGDEDKPLLLLVHGSPGFWFCWRKQIAAFREHFWVVAIDLKGFGDSERPSKLSYGAYTNDNMVEEIVTIIRVLGRSSANIIFNDSSGYLGWDLRSSYPEMVNKLVVLNYPFPNILNQRIHSMWSFYFKYWYLLVLQWPIVAGFLSKLKSQEILDKFLDPQTRLEAIGGREIDAYHYTFSRPGDLDGTIELLRGIDIFPPLLISERDKDWGVLDDDVPVPALLIMGAHHPIFSVESAYRTSEYVDRLRVKIIPGASTSMQVTHADVVNEAIFDFLDVSTRKRRKKMTNENSQATPADSKSFVGRVFTAMSSPMSVTSEVVSSAHRNITQNGWLSSTAALKAA